MTQTIQELLAKSSKDSQPTQYIDTIEAYDKWAKVYDTDGNFLQRLDTIEMRTLLPQFINLITKSFHESTLPILDLGCGTGRNTIQLLSALRTAGKLSDFSVIGLDASRGMLDVARTALAAYASAALPTVIPDVELGILDLLGPDMVELESWAAAGVMSTLVLEHIPLERFFGVAAGVLRTGGYLLVTNMHAEMGMRSQAGFTDDRGVKVRPTSYCHATSDVLEAARGAGFEAVENFGGAEDGVIVRGVNEGLGDVLGSRAKKWVGLRVWFGICFVKKV